MALRRRTIDIDDRPELRALVDELRDDETIVLRAHGDIVATIRRGGGTASEPTPVRWKEITEEDIAAFHAAAGSWKDVDTDRLLKDIYAARDASLELEIERDRERAERERGA